MSGAAARRFAAVTANALTLPALYWGMEFAAWSKFMSMWPATTSCVAGAAPR